MLPLSSRAILVKASLRSMASHQLSALLVPVGTLQDFDKTSRAFFWEGDEHVHGAQCKVAWEDVCAPTSKGGLGFCCLRSHNVVLLMKFLSKIHSDFFGFLDILVQVFLRLVCSEGPRWCPSLGLGYLERVAFLPSSFSQLYQGDHRLGFDEFFLAWPLVSSLYFSSAFPCDFRSHY
jgi:hypothetical protein